MIDLGDVVPLTLNVKDANGTLANATTVTLTITKPDGTTVTPTVTNASTGVYTVDYVTADLGSHDYRWVATGSNAGAWSGVFLVDNTSAKMLVSLEDFKAHINVPASVGTTQDEELREVIAAATAACADYTGRTLKRTTVIDTLTGGGYVLQLSATPVLSVTTVVESGVTLTASDYVLDGDASQLWRGTSLAQRCWAPGLRNVTVTYVAGYTDPPIAIRKAVLRMCEHLWQRTQNAPHPALGTTFSATGQPDESLPRATYLLPYQVQSWLTPYRVPGF